MAVGRHCYPYQTYNTVLRAKKINKISLENDDENIFQSLKKLLQKHVINPLFKWRISSDNIELVELKDIKIIQ